MKRRLILICLTLCASIAAAQSAAFTSPLETPGPESRLVPTLLVDTVAEANGEWAQAGPPDAWFSLDKLWHFVLSFTLTGASYHFAADRIGQEPLPATLEAVGFTLASGVIKEFWDLGRMGLFSWKDLLYDALGIAVGYFVFIYE